VHIYKSNQNYKATETLKNDILDVQNLLHLIKQHCMLSAINHAASYLNHLQAGGHVRMYGLHDGGLGGTGTGLFGSLVPPVTGSLSISGLAAPLPEI
jgi:hypothetical protein